MQKEKLLYGLIGYPLGHSLSPLMHNTAFKELQVEAEYKLFPLEERELEDFFKTLKKSDSPIFGLNVTVPYKEAVIPFLDGLSPFADKVKAVNTVVISKDRRFHGFNTDGPGFLTHLAELKYDIGSKRVVVLGAGGAARAIVSAMTLLPERPHSVRVYDIDSERAHRLLDDLSQRMDMNGVSVVTSIDDLNIEIADILINATPIGMNETDPFLIDPEMLHGNLFVYDLIYNPDPTALLQVASQRGAKTANGLGMLFYQGVLAFQHWAEIELEEPIKKKMWESLIAR